MTEEDAPFYWPEEQRLLDEMVKEIARRIKEKEGEASGAAALAPRHAYNNEVRNVVNCHGVR